MTKTECNSSAGSRHVQHQDASYTVCVHIMLALSKHMRLHARHALPLLQSVEHCDNSLQHLQGHVLYSGSDDCSFKGWDIRLPNSTVSASSSDQPAPQQSAIFSNRKSHSAGVTCISSHPRQDHVLVTGSYDEHVRLWDLRMIQRPVETCQVQALGLNIHKSQTHTLNEFTNASNDLHVSPMVGWGCA